MKVTIGLLLLLSLVACGDKTPNAKIHTVDTVPQAKENKKEEPVHNVSNTYGFSSLQVLLQQLVLSREPAITLNAFCLY